LGSFKAKTRAKPKIKLTKREEIAKWPKIYEPVGNGEKKYIHIYINIFPALFFDMAGEKFKVIAVVKAAQRKVGGHRENLASNLWAT